MLPMYRCGSGKVPCRWATITIHSHSNAAIPSPPLNDNYRQKLEELKEGRAYVHIMMPTEAAAEERRWRDGGNVSMVRGTRIAGKIAPA